MATSLKSLAARVGTSGALVLVTCLMLVTRPVAMTATDDVTSVTFETLGSDCYGGGVLRYSIGGTLINTQEVGADCNTSKSTPYAFTTTDPGVLALVGAKDSCLDLRVEKRDYYDIYYGWGVEYSNYFTVGYIRAKVSRTESGDETVCIADYLNNSLTGGGVCADRALSAGHSQNVWDNITTYSSNDRDDDGDSIPSCQDPDRDGDGVANAVDNCTTVVNPGQVDTDANGKGDACDPFDLDNDGLWNVNDNCPRVANAGQVDSNGDGFGDACDVRAIRFYVNAYAQGGAFSFSVGGVSLGSRALTQYSPNNHGELIEFLDPAVQVDSAACVDIRVTRPNYWDYVGFVRAEFEYRSKPTESSCLADFLEYSLSGGGTCADRSVWDGYSYHSGQGIDPDGGNTDMNTFVSGLLDSDGDGQGDLCGDPDNDNDGVLNGADNCPVTVNPGQTDYDSNGQGDACDAPDADGDGRLGNVDNCPAVPNPNQADGNNNGVGTVCDATERFLAAVPWAGNEALQHQVFDGGSLVLQAVATNGLGEAVALTGGTWDPGDGSAPIAINVSDSFVLEATHTYTGFVGQPFTAVITVTDDTGAVYTDTMKVVIAPTNRETKVNMAIDKGLWNLHKTQTRTTSDGLPSSEWHGAGYSMAATASAVQAFEINGHRESGDASRDPFVRNVARGLRYILSKEDGFLQQLSVPLQNGNDPDANGNGYGLWVDYNGHASYLGGQLMDALVASGTPDKTAETGQATYVRGRSYKDILQDLLDGYSYGIADNTGGWHYSFAGTSGSNDTSASHWWSIGVLASHNWGLDAPAWLKNIQKTVGIPLMQAYPGDGHFGYTDSTNSIWDDATNVTAAGLILMNADGMSQTDPRFAAASGYVNARYNSSMGNMYTMYQLTKAMRTALDDDGETAPIGLLSGSTDWYAGYADHLVANQNGSGAFSQTQGTAEIREDMATSWAIIILSPSLFELPPTAVCSVDATVVCQAGAVGGCNASGANPYASVSFDGSQSFAGDNAIAGYQWDFQDGSPVASTVSASHSFGSVGTFNVNLKVTDTKGNFSTVTCPVRVTATALPPVADAGGPYDVCPNRAPSVILDASHSIGRGSNIISYAWDWTSPINFAASDATGATTNQTAYFAALPAGTYDVGVKVTDDTPANEGGPFTSTVFTTVTVRSATDSRCNAAPVATDNNYTTSKNNAVSGNVSTNGTADSDADGDTFTAAVVTVPASGTLAFNANGTFTFTPATGFDGAVTFTYKQTDQYGGVSNTATVTIVVLPNVDPVAQPDTENTFSGTPVTVTVLTNDSDADAGQTLSVSGTSGGPANGSVVVNGNTTITYTPNLGFAGIDTFTYSVSDGNGGTASATVTITVTKRTATVTAGGGTKVYGTADPTFTPSSIGFLGADGIVVTQTARDAGNDVGTYATHAEATGATLANYDVTYVDGALIITPATAVATATGGTFTYDGQAHAGMCAVNGVNGEVLTGAISYSPGGGEPVNAGTYTVTCDFAATQNYTAANDTATIVINPAAPVATATGGTFTYDGQAHGGTCAVAGVNGEVLAGTTTYSSGGAPVNAGNHTVTCTFTATQNYTAASDTADIVINPAAPVATATGGTFTYDGQAHGGTCAVAGVNGEVLAGTTSYSSGGAPVDAGNHTVTCTFTATQNYAAASDTADIVINPAAAVATATGGTFTYDGQAHGGTCAVAGVNGEVLAGTTSYSSGGAPVNAGDHTVTCTFTATQNYAAASDTADIVINPAAAVATATGGTSTYDGQAHGGTCAVAGVNGEVLTGAISYSPGTGEPVAAGTYTVTCDFVATQNYTAASDTATITINQLAATVTAGGGTKVYGAADPTLTPSSTGFLGADGIVVTQTPREAGDDVGTYDTHAEATGAAMANYDVTYVDGALTITPATAVAMATGGTFTYDGLAHGGTCTVAGVNDEVLAGVISYSSGAAPTVAGDYTVTCTFGGTVNYGAAVATAPLRINPAPSTTVVTCTASVTYTGAPIEVCTANVTGAGGLDAAVTPVNYTANTNVGTAGASATYGGDANHTGSTGTGSFAITPATLTVSANSYTRSYLAPDPTLAGTLTGVVAGDGITASYSSTGIGSQVPGVYPTVPALADPGGKLTNYAVTTNNGTLTITNTAPVCSAATASPASIWPPNHKWVKVTINGVTDIDGGPLTFNIVSIFQDEPTNTKGDGNTAFDGKGVGTNTAWVRAERVGDRSGHDHRKGDGCDHEKRKKGHKDGDRCEHERDNDNGNGRVYHITFTATDSAGLACTGTVTVGVPHDQRGTPAVDDGPLFDSTVPTTPAGHGDGDGCKDNDHEHGRPDRDEDRDHYDGDKCDHSKGGKGHKKGDNCDHEKHVKDAKDRDDKNKRDEDDSKNGRGRG